MTDHGMSLRQLKPSDSSGSTVAIPAQGAEGRRRPLWVWLDAAATCNLACAHCYTLAMQSAAFMALDTYRRIVDELAASPARIMKFHVNWRGEPTANPRLATMLTIAGEHGWPLEFHTNGTLVGRRKAARLVSTGTPFTMQFSLDGGNAASFESNRGRGTWAKALGGLRTMLEMRHDSNSPRLGIHQLDLGIPLDDYDPEFTELVGLVEEYKVVPPVRSDGSVNRSEHGLPVPDLPCFWLGNALAIDHLGGAHTCILETNTPLGQLGDPLSGGPTSGVAEVLTRAAALRSLVIAQTRTAVTGCSNCRMVPGDARLAQPD
jgi:hypothetical protein